MLFFALPPSRSKGLRVVVLGGGDTAMDALRIALRAGARDALCIYRRDRDSMPADPKEMENAIEEGARFQFQAQPVRLLGNLSEEVTHIRCVRTQFDGADDFGRGILRPRPGSEFELPAEVVLVAYGFAPPCLPAGGEFHELNMREPGCLAVDSSQMTNLPGVFAAGSIARWPVSMIDVMQDARKAATEIDRYLTARRSQ